MQIMYVNKPEEKLIKNAKNNNVNIMFTSTRIIS